MFRFSFFISMCFMAIVVSGQSSKDAAVMIQSQINKSTPSITLTWPKNNDVLRYLIFRRSPDNVSWGSPIKNLTGADSSFVDTNIEIGKLYEYRVDKTTSNYTGYGYISAGIEIPAIEDRGVIILVVDEVMADSLGKELEQLNQDFKGDGYRVKWLTVSRNIAVANVKAKITNHYNMDPTNTKSLILIGHVPVPYSGAINPDGHGDHYGAWPTDIYYADVNGDWTDTNIETDANNPARIVNKIGDGKFDQSIINSTVELQTGRIDFYDMPAFSKSEVALMRDYLNKAHAYKHKLFTLADRAVIDDNFGYFSGEAFAASGYNNFAALVGRDQITEGDYFSTLSQEGGGYKWSYGCGGGWFSGAGGVGSTADFAQSDLNSAFTLLFGSYFGDWDVQNSFLRAPLAQGKTLTCSWSGRPHHQYHHMALGQSIGYSFAKGINNNNYFPNIYGINGRWIHNNLMGDPTLRNDVLSPPQSIEATPTKSGIKIEWTSSLENNAAYRLYYKKMNESNFTFLANTDSINLSHTIECIKDTGEYVFMVRAVKLVSTPSGSYYNISQGKFDTIVISQLDSVYAEFLIEYDDPHLVKLTNESSNYTNLYWKCTNGFTSIEENPTIKFDTTGIFVITLIASNGCFTDSMSYKIDVYISATEDNRQQNLTIFPNPAKDVVNVLGISSFSFVTLTDVTGRIWPIQWQGNKIILNNIINGYYILSITDDHGHSIKKPLQIQKI